MFGFAISNCCTLLYILHLFCTKRYGNILTGTSPTGASDAAGYEKFQFLTNMSNMLLYLGNDTR